MVPNRNNILIHKPFFKDVKDFIVFGKHLLSLGFSSYFLCCYESLSFPFSSLNRPVLIPCFILVYHSAPKSGLNLRAQILDRLIRWMKSGSAAMEASGIELAIHFR